MRTAIVTALLCLAIAVGLGMTAQARPAAARSSDLTVPASDVWFRSLPRDPELATRAFLDRVPRAMRERGEAASRSRYWVLAARIVFTLGGLLLFLFSGAASALNALVVRVTRGRWPQAFLFSFILLAYVLAVTLPVEVYAGYVRYRQFGFADLTFLDWLRDDLTNWFVLTLFYAVGIAVLMSVMRRRPRSWPVWAGIIYLALGSVYNVATPVVIEPLTNHYTPLPQSELKSEILRMVRSAGVRADDIYSKDASKQSRMLNAHVSGMFRSSRISVDDTTLTERYFPSVKAVVAHEVGHYVEAHVFKMVLFSSLVATLGFGLVALMAPLFVGRFGGAWHITRFESHAGIAVLWLLFLAWGFASDPILDAYARVQEAQADAYALDLSRAPAGLAEFMIHDADIARLQPTTLDLLLFYDHPSDASRVRSAMLWRAAHGDVAP
jgi:STE24 endopeptidase